MKISEIRIDGPVMTKTGRIGRVTAACDDGRVYVLFGSSDYPENMQASDLEPVSDPCNGCQKLEATRLKADVGNAMDVLRKDRDNWKATAHRYCRNAAYWREELNKLQKEALAEGGLVDPGHVFGDSKEHIHPAIHIEDFRKRPLAEVAKIYVMPSIENQLAELAKFSWGPEKLPISDDAKIVCELLEGSGPMTSREIADRLYLLEMCVLENLIEAREAGVVQLVDGKYQIVRD